MSNNTGLAALREKAKGLFEDFHQTALGGADDATRANLLERVDNIASYDDMLMCIMWSFREACCLSQQTA
jgi:hypothetical protein